MITDSSIARNHLDFSGFSELRAQARSQSPAAVQEVASQFEALFLQLMLRSMRQASLGQGILDNDQTRFYQDLLDKQLTLTLSSKGLRLAPIIAKQIAARPPSDQSVPTPHSDASLLPKFDGSPAPVSTLPRTAAVRPPRSPSDLSALADIKSGPATNESGASREAFVRELWPLAQRAGGQLGLDPRALIAQAALETGWGRSVLERGDGTSSHNLFGIKADDRWRGDHVVAPTLEYFDGQFSRRPFAFRAYASYAESFEDYVAFLRSNPRYQGALKVAGDADAFVSALQKAGFATDPAYANKIRAIMRSERLGDILTSGRLASS
ncbi:MAG: flagellar assembly peptidoglycan hydrolase FlgJ [Gammaproteobacteria bacterium]|nr:flagellar assembly peptidoglycan hydrolase FlgJ [Gammaproteobacteria bacterium]